MVKNPPANAGDIRGSILGVGRFPEGGQKMEFAKIKRLYLHMGFPGGSDGKESPCNAGDLGLIPEWGRTPGGGNGYTL